MGYEDNFYKIPEDTDLQESLSTMGRQMWDGIKSLFGGPSSFTAKRKYFNELYTITPDLKKKLVVMVKKMNNAVILPHSTMSQLISGKITQKEVDTTPGTTSTYNYNTHQRETHVYSKTQTVYRTRQNLDVFHHDRANQNHDVSNITNATCSYILDVGGGKSALLFFTFDNKKIKACQALTSNKFSSGDALSKYDTTALPGWDSISPSEYMKGGVQESAFYNEGYLNSTNKKLLGLIKQAGGNVNGKNLHRGYTKAKEELKKKFAGLGLKGAQKQLSDTMKNTVKMAKHKMA